MTLPSRTEFQRRISIWRRRHIVGLAYAVAPIALLVLWIFFVKWIPEKPPRWLDMLCVVTALLANIPAMTVSIRLRKRAIRDSGLFCAHCGHLLLDIRTGAGFLRTGACPTCNKQVMAA